MNRYILAQLRQRVRWLMASCILTTVLAVACSPPARSQSPGLSSAMQIAPPLIGGRFWTSNDSDGWSNGIPRSLASGQWDDGPWNNGNSQLQLRGDGQAWIDGASVMTVNGSAVRLYIYDRSLKKLWRGVCALFYVNVVSEMDGVQPWDGLYLSRGNHEATDQGQLATRTYDVRFLFLGRADVQKEVIYENWFSQVKPSEDYRVDWFGQPDIPTGRWIGYMATFTPVNDGKWVDLRAYRDLSGSQGQWEPVYPTLYDDGSWQGEPDNAWSDAQATSYLGYPPTTPFPTPAHEIHLRLDRVNPAQITDVAVYEMDPDPATWNFENGLQGWVGRGPVGVARSTAHFWAGAASLAISFAATSAGKSQTYVRPQIALAGRSVSFRLYLKRGTRISSVAPFAEYTDAQGVLHWTDAWTRTTSLAKGRWVEIVLPVPPSAAHVERLGVEYNRVAGASGEVSFLDSVQVQ